MIILWLVTGVSLVTSLMALIGVLRSRKRLEELSQLYWALRYQQGELRAHIQATGGFAKPSEEPDSPSRGSAEAFVPLSSVRR